MTKQEYLKSKGYKDYNGEGIYKKGFENNKGGIYEFWFRIR